MQNRYVADVGDFGKYGLLRALCLPDGDKKRPLSLGVVWYLTSNESHNNDGRHIGYLESTPKNLLAFRACDPDLYDGLGEIVRAGDRNVSAIRRQRILPEGTVYYERILDLTSSRIRPTPASRIQDRQEWVEGAVQATQGCDVVFVDPDNGIGTLSQAASRFGSKFVLPGELWPYCNNGQTLIVYHHLNRSATAENQIRDVAGQLLDENNQSSMCWAMRFRRGSARVFFMIPQKEHTGVLHHRLTRMLDTQWSKHFLIYPFDI